MKDLSINRGVISRERGNLSYQGEVPELKDGESREVYVIPSTDFEKIIRKGLIMLLGTHTPMEEETFKQFPDEVKFFFDDGSESGLYLDRGFYYLDDTECVWIRYASISEYRDEGELW